jgi:glutaredoxin
MVIITAEGCPSCEELKAKLANSKLKVEVLDVTKSLKAARIMRDLGVYKVPLLVTVEGDRVCTLDEKDMQVKCVKSEPSVEEASRGS